jgi:hypothetical protein
VSPLDPDVALFVGLASERLEDAVVAVTDAAALLSAMGVAVPYLNHVAVDLFDWTHDLGRLAGTRPTSESD